MFAKIGTEGTKASFKLDKIPGAETIGSIPESEAINNIYLKGDNLYIVGQNTLYVMDINNDITVIGSLGIVDGKVQMEELNEYLCILKSNGEFYTYNEDTSTLSEVTDSDFPDGSSIAVLTQRVIVSKPDTQQFYWSELGAPRSWTALGFASKESSPDKLIRVMVKAGELWLLGERSIEIWQPTSSTLLPYARVGSTYIQKGCKAILSAASFENILIWLADDGSVYSSRSYSPEKISTDAIDEELGRYSLSEVESFTYEQEGHSFYVLTVPGKITLVYDVTTGFWHERQSKGYDDWRMCNSVARGDEIIACDKYFPNIYSLKTSVFTENNNDIIWGNTFPVVYDDDKRIIYDKLLIDIDTGLGNESNLDPKLMMEYSDDGGYLFKNQQFVSIGKVGEYRKRAIFRRLGQARNRIFKISGNSQTKISISGAFVDGRIGK
jgi:hypothetical protein